MTLGQRTLLRLLFFFAGFLIMTNAPFVFFVVFLFVGFVFFPVYVEGMILALLYDLFFSVPTVSYFDINVATLLVSIIIFLIVYFIKKFTRLSSYEI